jgi:ABC-type multidrug transport system ATPase subunit
VNLAQAFSTCPSCWSTSRRPRSAQHAEVRRLRPSGRRTLLLCTHDLAEARALTSRVAILSRGRLVACGPTAGLLDAGDPLALFRDAAREAS